MRFLKFFLLLITPLLFTGCNVTTANGEPSYYVYAFSNFEAIFLIIGLTIGSFIFESILAPVAISFMALLYIKNLFLFIFSAFSNKNAEQNEFFDGSIIMNVIMMIIALTILLIKIPVGIKTVSATETPTPIKDYGVRVWDDVVGTYTLNPGRKLSSGDNCDAVFGKGAFFSTETTSYKELIGTNNLVAQKMNANGDLKFYLPLALVFPMAMVDSLLYGTDGSNGILAKTFPDIYPMLVHNPGNLFTLMADNNPSTIKDTNENIALLYSQLIYDTGVAADNLNRDMAFVITNYNLSPYNVYMAYKEDFATSTGGANTPDIHLSQEEENAFNEATKTYNTMIMADLKSVLKSDEYQGPFSALSDKDNIIIKLDDQNYKTNSAATPNDYTLPADDPAFKPNKNTIIDFNADSSTNLTAKQNMVKLISMAIDKSDYDAFKPVKVSDKKYVLDPQYQNPLKMDHALFFNFYSTFLNGTTNLSSGDLTVSNLSKKNIYNTLENEELNIEKKVFSSIPSPRHNNMTIQAFLNSPNKFTQADKDDIINDVMTIYENKYFPELTTVSNPIGGSIPYYSTFVMKKSIEDLNLQLRADQIKFITDISSKINSIKNPGGTASNVNAQTKLVETYLLANNQKIQEQMQIATNNLAANNRLIKADMLKILKLKMDKEWLDRNTVASNTQKAVTKDISFGEQLLGVHTDKAANEPGSFVLDLVWGIVALLLSLVLKLITIIVKALFAPLYGFIFSLHTLGIIMLLFLSPISFIKDIIMEQKFEKLFDPFKNFLGYRLWDFAVLLATEIMMIAGPILIRVFDTMNALISSIFSLLFLFGIFWLTGILIDSISKAVGSDKGGFNLFGSVAKQGMKVTTAAAGASIALGAGAGLSLAKNGGKLGGIGGALANSEFGQKVGAVGSTVKSVAGGLGSKFANTELGQTLGGYGTTAAGVVGGLAGGLKNSSVGQMATSAANSVGNGASALGGKVSGFTHSVGNGASALGNKVKDSIANNETIQKGVSGAKAVGEGVSEIGKSVADAAVAGAKGAGSSVKSVGSTVIADSGNIANIGKAVTGGMDRKEFDAWTNPEGKNNDKISKTERVKNAMGINSSTPTSTDNTDKPINGGYGNFGNTNSSGGNTNSSGGNTNSSGGNTNVSGGNTNVSGGNTSPSNNSGNGNNTNGNSEDIPKKYNPFASLAGTTKEASVDAVKDMKDQILKDANGEQAGIGSKSGSAESTKSTPKVNNTNNNEIHNENRINPEVNVKQAINQNSEVSGIKAQELQNMQKQALNEMKGNQNSPDFHQKTFENMERKILDKLSNNGSTQLSDEQIQNVRTQLEGVLSSK
jgi:hypothetical protein